MLFTCFFWWAGVKNKLIDHNIACAFKCENCPSQLGSNALHTLVLQHLDMATSIYFSQGYLIKRIACGAGIYIIICFS